MKKLICLLTVLITFATGSAQINQSEFLRSQSLRPGIHFKSWKFDKGAGVDKYIQLAAPVSYSMAFGSRVGVDITTSYFISAFNRIPSLSDISDNDAAFWHLTDTYIRGSVLLGNNLALLTVGVGVPTGEAILDAKELPFAGFAANRPLDNPVTSFGSGGSINIGLAVAQEFDSWVAGFGLGYSRRNQYEATFFNSAGSVQRGDVNPGDEFNLTVGIEREFEISNGNAKFLADVIYTNYSKDELNGQPFYEAGDKILVRGQVQLPILFNPLVLSLIHRWRLDNTATNAALIENGNELELQSALFLPLGNTFTLKGILQSQFYYNTLNEGEDATIHGLGGGFILNLSRHFSFDPTIIYLTGSINSGPDTKIDVTGIEAKGGFTFRF